MTPNPARIETFAQVDDLSVAAAQYVAHSAMMAVEQRGVFTLALSGGSTPRRLFELLATHDWAGRIPWSATHVFWADERCVTPEHEDSNYRVAHELLLSRVAVPDESVHRIRGEDEPVVAAEDYETELRERLGPDPALDLVLLGMGPDGHTASLFPGTEALQEQDRLVTANFVPKLDAWRITLTYSAINAARRVVFMVAGADKTEMLAVAVGAQAASHKPPAALVHPASGDLVWLVDEATAEGAL